MATVIVVEDGKKVVKNGEAEESLFVSASKEVVECMIELGLCDILT